MPSDLDIAQAAKLEKIVDIAENYDIAPDESPAQKLIDIAEKEFKLSRLPIPEQYRDAVVQRLDTRSESEAGEETGKAHVH